MLDNEVWRQIVSEPGGTRSALDQVYQMVADVPALLEEAVSLTRIDAEGALLEKSSAATKSLLAMAESLRTWHDEFCAASPTPRYWLAPSRVTIPANTDDAERLFPLCFEFQSLDSAVPIVMCWAVLAQLYSHVIQIYDLVHSRLDRQTDVEGLLLRRENTPTSPGQTPEPSAVDRDHPGIDAQIEGGKMARSVCQSLEYFHRVEMGTYGSHATTYPCWSSRQYFRLHPGYERELSWVQNVHQMEGDGLRWGLSMMTFADIDKPLQGSL